MPSEICSLKFKGTRRPDPAQIGEFLFLFRGTYAAAVRLIDIPETQASLESARKLKKQLIKNLNSLDAGELDSLFSRSLGHDKLGTEKISHQSPLEIEFVGALIAILAIGLIISGGKMKVVNLFEIELNQSLGKGIKELLQALSPRKKARIGYGVRGTQIKLSKKELNELFKQDPAQRGRGGFQRLLVKLQKLTNRSTRIMELNGEDIDRIKQYSRNPKKGGFQSRIRKIFEKHFKFDED